MPQQWIFPVRFEWERIAPVNEWVNLVRKIPAASPLLREHRKCPPVCIDSKGRPRLRGGTLKQIAITLATFANPDGTNAHPGIEVLAIACGRDRSTAMAGLAHLETVGLVMAASRAGQLGVARWHATVYYLSTPPVEVIAELALGAGDQPVMGNLPAAEEQRTYAWFQKDSAAG